MDDDALAAAVAGRAWAVHVNTPPRLTDISRPDLLARIAGVLTVPNPIPQVPVCVLHGLSGIGKTSLSAGWAADRGDDYPVVFWIDATTAGSVESSFHAVADGVRQRAGCPCREAVAAGNGPRARDRHDDRPDVVARRARLPDR